MTTTIEVHDDVVDGEIVGPDEIVEDNPTPETKRIRQVREYIDSLYDLAAFLEEHPDVVPLTTGVEVSRYVSTADDLALLLRKLGTCEKIDNDYYSGGKVKIGPHYVKVQTGKENTCKKIPTGAVVTKAVEADPKEPVPEGAKNVRTVTTVVYDVDEPVLQWECPSLLNPGKAS